jgi:predicted signal transduction protein with EAL and GGDEF domain
MSDEALLDALPDWVAFIRADGRVTHHAGGRDLPLVAPGEGGGVCHLRELVPAEACNSILRMVRRSLTERQEVHGEFDDAQASYQIRVLPQGPRRTLCVIRRATVAREERRSAPGIDSEPLRRGFLADLERRVTDARLRERPLAVGVLLLEELSDIGGSIDFSIADQLHALIFEKLAAVAARPEHGRCCAVSRLGESALGFVIEGAGERDRIESIAEALYAVATQPAQIRDATFQLTAAIGIAVLGRDASQAELLLEHARSAMLEARRSALARVQFYSDTLRLLPVARLDIEQQLRQAIEADQIGLAYRARHKLDTGELTGLHAYMRWIHPVWGEIPPARFLPIADATGLATALSQAALRCLAADCAEGRVRGGIPVSFGALRQHVASGQLVDDCRNLTAEGRLSMERFELRIAERTLTSLPDAEKTLGALKSVGAQLIIDEVGREVSPIMRLAEMPLAALQIDRALVVASRMSIAAQRCCRGLVSLAQALDIGSIAGGIDDEDARRRMAEFGCQQGMGDLYGAMARGGAEAELEPRLAQANRG